jgi:ribosomal protein S8
VHAFSSIESVRINKRSTASAKQIVLHQLQQGQVQQLTISTDRGILTGLQASSKKLGGVPLFKIY